MLDLAERFLPGTELPAPFGRVLGVLLRHDPARTGRLHANAISLARALRRRAWNVPALQALLEEAAGDRRAPVAGPAASLWLADPRHRDARVRALLNDDPSAIVLPAVFNHVHRRRQEWLDPYLERRELTGRFVSGETVYVLPATDGFHRWLPRQQRRFARLHREMIAERDRPISSRVGSVRVLARMPVHGAEHLRPYVQHEEVPIQDAALGALVWMDRPAGALPVLLDHLGGDRARVAMYALPRLARMVPEARVIDTLGALLERPRLKVTVRKEALRLLGGCWDRRALALVETAWRMTALHRDVAIAALHAARQWLPDEAAWGMLEQARTGDESLALSLLDPNPAFVHPAHRPRYRALLLGPAEHAEARVRATLFGRSAPHAPGATD